MLTAASVKTDVDREFDTGVPQKHIALVATNTIAVAFNFSSHSLVFVIVTPTLATIVTRLGHNLMVNV